MRNVSACADLNSNSSPCGSTYTYDVANRCGGSDFWDTIRYSYAPGNKRVWRGSTTSWSQAWDELTYYSAGRAKLVAYNLSASGSNLRAVSTGYYEYFGGKLLKNAQGWVNQDRLGSIGKYFPYGEERPSATANGKEKFATYTRDAETGLDYAQNRYHSVGQGRFLSEDSGPSNPGDPGTWNCYPYVGGDPVNRNDPAGLCWLDNLNPNAVYGLAAQGYSYEDLCYRTVFAYDLGEVNSADFLTFSPGFAPGGTGAAIFGGANFQGLNGSGVRQQALAISAQVRNGYSDCKGLADFADFVARNTSTTEDFISAFDVLNLSDWKTMAMPGVGGVDNPIYFTPSSSGYLPEFQNLPGDLTNQSHHFAAFLQMGYTYGATNATDFAVWFEKFEAQAGLVNKGDILLGSVAGWYGAQIANGEKRAEDMGAWMRKELCK